MKHTSWALSALVLPLLWAGSAEAKPLSAEAVDRVINKYANRITQCYVRHATADTGHKVLLKLMIRPNGRVRTATVDARGATAKLKRCVIRHARRFRFPRADSKTILHYPFEFRYSAR